MEEMEKIKEALKLIKDFEKKKDISLINKKGLEDFAKLYKKFEAKLKIKKFIEETVTKELKPLQNQNQELKEKIQLIIDRMPGKPVNTEEQIVDAVPIEEIEEAVDNNIAKNEPKKEVKWEVQKDDEMETHKCDKHTITVIKAEEATFVSVDGGPNEKVADVNYVEKLKKDLEEEDRKNET